MLAVAALGLAASLPAAGFAQDARTYVATGDGGRYVKLIDPKTRVVGYAPPAVQTFRGHVDRLLGQLDAMPEVNRPPSGLCHQLQSWIEVSGAPDARVLGGEVGVMRPLQYLNGRCIKTNNGLVMIGLNRTSDIAGRNDALVADAEGRDGRHWFVLTPDVERSGRLVLKRNQRLVVALTRPDAPLLVPVSAERYVTERLRQPAVETAAQAGSEDRITEADIERWRREERPRRAAEMEASLKDVAASLTPQQLAEIRAANAQGLELAEQTLRDRLRLQAEADARGRPRDPQLDYWRRAAAEVRGSNLPACLKLAGYVETLDLSGACPSGQQVVEFNPAYFDVGRPGDLQLLTLVTPLQADSGSEPSRRAIWEALDVERLAALVR
ncbi:hypothetical protein DJ019_04060 [Phenylobacterium kunshanense]|uniref:DUF4893 domain-containing protein n=2 Tax=Phenylobacterium kunshanense TaxID=1445034 RepID=A0A328BPF7_9CAUL|nr:hypothetical protein DJ019_04060 [Phenylobacterium kunshanense]